MLDVAVGRCWLGGVISCSSVDCLGMKSICCCDDAVVVSVVVQAVVERNPRRALVNHENKYNVEVGR